MVSPPMVQPSVQRSDPIPVSLVLLTTFGSMIAALGSVGTRGEVVSSAQAPRNARESASGQQRAGEMGRGIARAPESVRGGRPLLGATPPHFEPTTRSRPLVLLADAHRPMAGRARRCQSSLRRPDTPLVLHRPSFAGSTTTCFTRCRFHVYVTCTRP